jgi:hypothetical protein
MKPCDIARQVTTQKNKCYQNMIQLVTQHSYFDISLLQNVNAVH